MHMGIKLKFFAAAFVAMLAAGCGSDKGGGEEGGGGGGNNDGYDAWVLSTWKGGTELAGKVYLQLDKDGSFALYQCITTPGYTAFTGTYTISGDAEQVLSGTYDPANKPWQSSYVVEKMTAEELRIRSSSDGTVSVYVGVVIPDYVKDGVTAKNARSSVVEIPFL